MNKSALTAFFLGFLPGAGHLYINKKGRGLFYGILFFGLFFVTAMLVALTNDDDPMVMLVLAPVIWGVNMLDLVITLLSNRQLTATGPQGMAPGMGGVPYPSGLNVNQVGEANDGYTTHGTQAAGVSLDHGGFYEQQGQAHYGTNGHSYQGHGSNGATAVPQLMPQYVSSEERILTVLMSFIPGLGHLRLGLMNRGFGFMIAFFGLFLMILLLVFATNRDKFMIFMLVLPGVWVYSFFDAIKQLSRKSKGESVPDQTIFEEMEKNWEQGHKSKVLAMFLSIFPGAGHMYLGLQTRGIQFMGAFLFTFYIMDVLHLSVFFFLIPILWFYSFFDALHAVSKYQPNSQMGRDIAPIEWVMKRRRMFGTILVLLGMFYLADHIFLDFLRQISPTAQIFYFIQEHFQTAVVCLLLIGGGVKLLFGRTRYEDEEYEEDKLMQEEVQLIHDSGLEKELEQMNRMEQSGQVGQNGQLGQHGQLGQIGQGQVDRASSGE
ncbi:hypothetical protein [Brevibacillus dissolubilis]|uniref:hypothetical protein n=1 Tax=Brevibacillus dissolubilis TaxID=1844116 RepID=UPI0011176552|nr:hypothetical protein [Brevibacillus dissolubilis]